MSLIISSINWNYKPNDLSGLFAKYDLRMCNFKDTQVTQASKGDLLGFISSCHEKEADHRDTTIFFTDYRDMKFKLTAHRLYSENRNTVLWNKITATPHQK